MFLTITSIVVATLFGFAFAVSLRQSNINQRLHKRIDTLKGDLKAANTETARLSGKIDEQAAELKRYNRAAYSENNEYVSMYSDCGFYTVVRQVEVDGQMFATVIKRFTDDDTDFNRNEANELCEILNS